MDPTTNLNEQRELVKEIQDLECLGYDDPQAVERLAEAGARLSELVQALDEWMTHGGFLPKDWQR